MSKIQIFVVALFLTIITPLGMYAQNSVISGVVVDRSGAPLVGVSVRYKDNTRIGTVTNVEGKFSIQKTGQGKTLLFSYVGMNNTTYLLKDNTKFPIRIVMDESASELDQVVVT